MAAADDSENDGSIPPTSSSTSLVHHTWVAGEDAERLVSAARSFGLQRSRAPLKPWQLAARTALDLGSSLSSVRMHSVGTLGVDERVDEQGRILIKQWNVRHRTVGPARGKAAGEKARYGALQGLFREEDGGMIAKTEEVGDEEELVDEEVMEEIVEGGSIQAAVFGIVKGTVGPAILYLPRGMESSGWAVAVPAMLFATIMFVYNAYCLLDCWAIETERNLKRVAKMVELRALLGDDTNGVGDHATNVNKNVDDKNNGDDGLRPTPPKLLTYPELARRSLGRWSILVELGIALMQYGVCLTYLIFVPQNLHECVRTLTGRRVSKAFFLWAMIALEIPVSLIKDIRKLTPLNVTATLLIAYGLLSVLIMAVIHGLGTLVEDGPVGGDDGDKRYVFQENLASLPFLTESWFLFIGTSFFMMEGSMTLVVPLQEAVYRKEDKAKFPKVNAITTWYIASFYLIFALFCCAAFGNSMKTALTASLPTGGFAASVQLAYSVAVTFTFPLQAFPAQEVARKVFLGSDDGGECVGGPSIMKRDILAASLTVLLGVIASLAIDYLGNVVSILGSLFGIPLALVFPPLMHNALVKDATALKKWMNLGVVAIGFFAMGAATYSTIANWDTGAEGG